MSEKMLNQCVICNNVKMRRDVCGTYCAAGYERKKDGSCDGFDLYKSRETKRAISKEALR